MLLEPLTVTSVAVTPRSELLIAETTSAMLDDAAVRVLLVPSAPTMVMASELSGQVDMVPEMTLCALASWVTSTGMLDAVAPVDAVTVIDESVLVPLMASDEPFAALDALVVRLASEELRLW